MIRGIHYFSAEVKTKIDVIPRGWFKLISSRAYTIQTNIGIYLYPIQHINVFIETNIIL